MVPQLFSSSSRNPPDNLLPKTYLRNLTQLLNTIHYREKHLIMRILVVGSFAFVIYLFPLWKPPEMFIHAAAPWFITLILTVLPILLTIRHFLFIHYVPLSLDFIFLFSNLIFLRGGESDDSDRYCQEDEERLKKLVRKKARPKKEKRMIELESFPPPPSFCLQTPRYHLNVP